MKVCEVTGRVHRTSRELAAELARVDAVLAALADVQAALQAGWGDASPVPDALYEAWNDLHDAERAVEQYWSDVEWNPRPIPPGEAGTYRLMLGNID